VGSIFRTADATGVSFVYTTGITPHPKGNGREKVAKVALGAERVVPTRHFDSTKEVVDFLRRGEEGEKKWTLVGMETTDRSLDYTSLSYPGGVVEGNAISTTTSSSSSLSSPEEEETPPIPNHDKGGTVLFLGNEVSGVDTDILQELDHVVEIPMFGSKNSLNVAACAPVVLYEILRQWGAMDLLKKNEEEESQE